MNSHEIKPTLTTEESSDSRGLGGLLALVDGEERPFPLAEVRVRAAIAGDCCRTVIEQRFRNSLQHPVEAVHIFPLPDEGAVVEVEMHVGDRVIRAECRERAEAEREFAAARDAGHRAVLLTAERADVHTLRVTNLAAGVDVVVRVVVVERLASIDGALRWRFPTVIAPRYLPGNETGHGGPGVLLDTDRVPDASRLQPPLRLSGGTMLDLEVQIAGPVGGVESSLHAVRVDVEGGALRVAPSARATLDRDFVLAVRPVAGATAGLRALTDGSFTLVMVEPPAVTPSALPRDVVFVIDISGSMQGRKLDSAKRALIASLHGLVARDRFRLIAFDDQLEEFRAEFSDYNDSWLRAGDRWIAGLRSRGGTEMLPAIQAALSGDTPERRVRTVLFVTDGEAHNEAELVAAVANRRGSARFFTLGIDTAVNSALLRRLARVGGGTCELAGPHDDVEEVISRLDSRFGDPIAFDVRVEGLTPARPEPAVLFSGRPASFLVEGAPDTVVVSGRTAVGAFRVEATPSKVEGLGALWARDRVAWLEDRLVLHPVEEEALRPEIVRLGVKFGIASRFTAFVAVDRLSKVDGAPVEVVQPVELPTEWDPGFAAAGAAPAAACAAPTVDFDKGGMYAAEPTRGRARRSATASRAASASGPAAERGILDFAKRLLGGLHAGSGGKDPAGDLARAQGADGSFGGDLRRTAAALAALVLLGHTRQRGLRRRTVAKAAAWLHGRSDAAAVVALAALDSAERGERPDVGALRQLADAGEEGELLAAAIDTVERQSGAG